MLNGPRTQRSHSVPTSISELQRVLNRRALHVARVLSPLFTAANLLFFAASGNAVFLVVAGITASIGLSSILSLGDRSHTIEFVVAASGIGLLVTSHAVPDMVRGTISAALVLFPMMAVLLLKRAAAVRVTVLFALIIVGQSAWIVTGNASAGPTTAHILVSLTALGFGVGATWILRRTMEASENRAILEARRFRTLFENAPSAIWEEDWSGPHRAILRLHDRGITDLRAHFTEHPDEFLSVWSKTRYLDVNSAGLRMVGAATREEAFANARPEPPPDPTADAFIEDWVALASGLDHMTFEATGSTIDGRTADLHMNWAASQGPDGLPDYSRVIVTMTDITELRSAQRRLDRLVESKDELVASVSHELRTPLTGILGIASEVRDNLVTMDPVEAEALLDLIVQQASEVTQIVEDLMIAARSDLNTLAIRPTEIDIRAEVDLVLSSITGHEEPEIDIPRGLKAWGDSLRFRQVIRNLLTNAQHYGGPSVTVTAREAGDDVAVRVIDDGDGVPEGDEARIFEPFGQSDSASQRQGSMGLGLAVSRRLARLMEGDLVYRRDNGVTVFEVRIPTSASATAAVAV